jgi:hypothetical protein
VVLTCHRNDEDAVSFAGSEPDHWRLPSSPGTARILGHKARYVMALVLFILHHPPVPRPHPRFFSPFCFHLGNRVINRLFPLLLGVAAIRTAGLDFADVVLSGLDNLLNSNPISEEITFPRYNTNCARLNPFISYFNLGIAGFNLAQFSEENVLLTSSSDGPNSGRMTLLIQSKW